jgi:hypothetical protein
MSAMTSGGSCRSASIITTASPVAWSRPAAMAAWWPKLRDSRSSFTRRSAVASEATMPAEASRLPSSTKSSS